MDEELIRSITSAAAEVHHLLGGTGLLKTIYRTGTLPRIISSQQPKAIGNPCCLQDHFGNGTHVSRYPLGRKAHHRSQSNKKRLSNLPRRAPHLHKAHSRQPRTAD